MKPSREENSLPWRQSRDWIVVALLCCATCALKSSIVALREVPGHGDIAQYYTLSKNIAEGRGMFLDYVATWLSPPDELRVSGVGYWMPLASWISALGMTIEGDTSFFAAGRAMAVFTSLVPAVIYLLGREALGSRIQALLAALLAVSFHAFLDRGSQVTSFGPVAVLAPLALFGVLRSLDDRRWLWLVGSIAAIAHMNRSDGLLWLPVAFAAIFLACRGGERGLRPRDIWWAGAAYAIALSPLLISSYLTQGTLLPAGQWRVALLTEYPDLYSLPSRVNWDTYRAQGLGPILAAKWDALLENLVTVGTSLATGDGMRGWDRMVGLTPYAWLALGWSGVFFLRRKLLLISGIRLAADLTLYALIFTYTGHTSFISVLCILYPVLLCGAARSLTVGWTVIAGKQRAWQPRAVAATVAVLALVGWMSVGSVQKAHRFIRQRAAASLRVHHDQQKIFEELIKANDLDDGAFFVAQTIVHSMHASTGLRVASLPYRATGDEILDISDRLGVTHVLLGRHEQNARVWPELNEILSGPRFREVASLELGKHEYAVWEISAP